LSKKYLSQKSLDKVKADFNRQNEIVTEIPAITEEKAADGTTIGPKVTG